jgi:hypothetical protein
MTYLSRELLLARCTTLAEDDVALPGGGLVRIRELTAAQRTEASRIANTSGALDLALWYAVVVQMGVIDPATGQPLLSKEDVAALTQGRFEVLQHLCEAILRLSEMGPEGLKSGDSADDAGQPDTQGGAAAARRRRGGPER